MAELLRAGFRVALYGGYWNRYPETRCVARGLADPLTVRKAIAGAGYQQELDNFDVALGKGDMPNAFQAISEPLIEEFAAIGGQKAIHRKIDEYRAAGVSLPAVGMFYGAKGSGLDPNATLEAAIG